MVVCIIPSSRVSCSLKIRIMHIGSNTASATSLFVATLVACYGHKGRAGWAADGARRTNRRSGCRLFFFFSFFLSSPRGFIDPVCAEGTGAARGGFVTVSLVDCAGFCVFFLTRTAPKCLSSFVRRSFLLLCMYPLSDGKNKLKLITLSRILIHVVGIPLALSIIPQYYT